MKRSDWRSIIQRNENYFRATDIGLSVRSRILVGDMNSRTFTIATDAKREDVFEFLAEPKNLPLWATEFCEAIRREGEHWIVDTCSGPMYFAIDADAGSGVIEMHAGPEFESMNTLPIHVFKAGGRTFASFVFLKEPKTPMEMYNAQCRSMAKELKALVERFGGGEVDVPILEQAHTYSGYVCENLAAVRDFYVQHFGFEVTFDAEFYAHLTHPSTDAQLGLLAKGQSEGNLPGLDVPVGATGHWLSMDFEDVDLECDRLKAEGVEIVQEPLDQPWGERTCVCRDPNGVLIYLASKIEVDDSMKAFFTDAAVLA